jgi:hypothetical protein
MWLAMMRAMCRCLSLAAIVALAGCQQNSGPQLAPAGGVVRLNGKPLAGARLIFNPASGRPAQGTADKDGRFQLSTMKPNDGAVVGPHRVAVIAPRSTVEAMPGSPEAAAAAAEVSELPKHYSDPQTSGLEYEVQAGKKNDFAIDLK